MKKYVLPFMLLLIFVLSPVYGEKNTTEQRVTVFIDISGSMYPVFSEIKQAVLIISNVSNSAGANSLYYGANYCTHPVSFSRYAQNCAINMSIFSFCATAVSQSAGMTVSVLYCIPAMEPATQPVVSVSSPRLTAVRIASLKLLLCQA